MHSNYTCKSWWESQQHTQHTFLPGSFPIHEKAHEPWIPEAKQWEMRSWRFHWLAKKKKTKHIYRERFRYSMKNPSCMLGMVFNNNSLCLIKCNWVLKHGMGVTIWNVDLFFHICYTVKYSKEKWKLNLDIWEESGWQAGITLLKGMHLKSLTAQDLGLKTLITAQLYPFKQRNHMPQNYLCA